MIDKPTETPEQKDKKGYWYWDFWNWDNPNKPIMDTTWMSWGIVTVDKFPDGTWQAAVNPPLVGGE